MKKRHLTKEDLERLLLYKIDINDFDFTKVNGRIPDWLIKYAVDENFIAVDKESESRFIENVQPASVDVTLGNKFKFFIPYLKIDPGKDQNLNMFDIEIPINGENPYDLETNQKNAENIDKFLQALKSHPFLEFEDTLFGLDDEGYYLNLPPLGFCLSNINELVASNQYFEFFVAGKSKIARCGTGIEDAGYADPGFKGRMTIEIRNANMFNTVILRPGMKIGQLLFSFLAYPSLGKYGDEEFNNHFQNSYTVRAGSGEV